MFVLIGMKDILREAGEDLHRERHVAGVEAKKALGRHTETAIDILYHGRVATMTVTAPTDSLGEQDPIMKKMREFKDRSE